MATSEGGPGLERNLRLLAWFVPASRVYFWTPVFFLFFSERFGVAEVLELEAIYYAGVVLLEVPSGYFSDRVGRRLTLWISSAATSFAFVLFLLGGEEFHLFALAQLAKAVGYAFLSGTDTSLHFDTLSALGREDEFALREARFARNGFWAAAAAAVVGGAVGSFDLRVPYLFSLVTALLVLGLGLRLGEPPREKGGYASDGFTGQLVACLSFLRRPFLAWLFVYFVVKITMEHIPYTFTQPYLLLVLGEEVGDMRTTPLASGLLVGGIAFVASFAAAQSVALRDRLGLGGALLAVAAVQTGLIGVMAWALSPWVVPLLLLRSVQGAVANPLINAAIAPAVPQARRASFLSLHSLAGRLGYSGVLVALGALVGTRQADDPEALASLLFAGAVFSVTAWLGLAATIGALRRGGDPPRNGS